MEVDDTRRLRIRSAPRHPVPSARGSPGSTDNVRVSVGRHYDSTSSRPGFYKLEALNTFSILDDSGSTSELTANAISSTVKIIRLSSGKQLNPSSLGGRIEGA